MPACRKAAVLEELRCRVRKLERREPVGMVPLPLAVPAIDAVLPKGGLPLACLHEVAEATTPGPATGFAAMLLAHLVSHAGGAVLWCSAGRDLHGPGLACFGLHPDRMIVLRARNDREILWAAEEGLRCPGLVAVLAETRGIPGLTATRRLQLAAEATGVTGILLLRRQDRPAPSAAATRWRIAAAPGSPRGSTGLGAMC